MILIKLSICILCLLASPIIAIHQSTNFILHKHAEETGARCLDGSKAALYVRKGELNKTLIFFQGGGMCSGLTLNDTINSCYGRSKTPLGSSALYPQTFDFQFQSIISSNPAKNPLYYNWNHAYIPYCDGSLHQGSKLAPISYKSRDLYFRGSNNTLQHLNYLNSTFNFFNNQQIVVSGTSAGGIAVYLWGNHIMHQMSHPEGLLLIPDSGIFISDFFNPVTNKTADDMSRQMFDIVNNECIMPLTQCLQVLHDQHECFKIQNIPQYLLPKTFIIQSLYDQWGLQNIAQIGCLKGSKPSSLFTCNDTEIIIIQAYKSKIEEALHSFAQYDRNQIWGISCVQHGFIQDDKYFNTSSYEVPTSDGTTILQTLTNFIRTKQHRIVIDTVSWPNNVGCSGRNGKIILQD